MRNRITPIAFAMCCALALTVSSCGDKKDAAEADPPAGPESSQGKILEAAKNTAELSNERSKKAAEAYERTKE